MSDRPKTQYIQTDLDLVAAFDLTSLVSALEQRDLFALSLTHGDDGRWYCTLEIEVDEDEEPVTPEGTISVFLDAIEDLSAGDRDAWNRCSSRVFDIGFDCGDEPWGFQEGLSSQILQRLVNCGAALRWTLYPPCDESRVKVIECP